MEVRTGARRETSSGSLWIRRSWSRAFVMMYSASRSVEQIRISQLTVLRRKKQDLTGTENQSSQNLHRGYRIALLRFPQLGKRVGDDFDPHTFDSDQTRRIDRHWCDILARNLDWCSDGRVVRIQSREQSLERCQSERKSAVVHCVENLKKTVNDGANDEIRNTPRCSSLPKIDQPILHTQPHHR